MAGRVPRAGLLALSLAGLAVANLLAPHLPDPGSLGVVAWFAAVAFPLATLTPQALCGLPARRRALTAAAIGAAAVAAAVIAAGLAGTPATLAKLVCATLVGMLLGSLLSSLREVAVIAVLVAAVDIYSVAAGPTHAIAAHHPSLLGDLTLTLVAPGGGGSGQIGASDLTLFALFLAAAIRFGLPRWRTWSWMTASFGATMALAWGFDAALPALPLLGLAFLAGAAPTLLHGAGGSRDSPERES